MTLATYITCLRILLIIPIIFLIYFDSFLYSILALSLFIVAGLSDYLDGFVARKTESISSLGALLDLLADKLLVCVTLFWLVFLSEEIHLMIPTTVIITRELVVSSLRQFIVEKVGENPIKVSNIGKSKTTVQFISIAFLIISPWSGLYINFVSVFLIWLAAFLSVYSLINYLSSYRSFFKR